MSKLEFGSKSSTGDIRVRAEGRYGRLLIRHASSLSEAAPQCCAFEPVGTASLLKGLIDVAREYRDEGPPLSRNCVTLEEQTCCAVTSEVRGAFGRSLP